MDISERAMMEVKIDNSFKDTSSEHEIGNESLQSQLLTLQVTPYFSETPAISCKLESTIKEM